MRDEFRVGMTPGQVARLVAQGHAVAVESGAGLSAGFGDGEYVASGARLCSHEDAYGAELVVKVKCPLREEYALLRDGQTLFTYLHFDGNTLREDIEAIVARGVTGIAYEWVKVNGGYPLLDVMSRITGALFARRALDLLLAGRRHLGGAYGLGTPRARAMVVGSGHIGANAIAVLARNDVDLVLVDKHPETLDARLAAVWPGWTSDCAARRILFNEERPDESVAQLRAELPDVDVLIGAAVRRPSCPKQRCPYLADRAAIATMRHGSVLCDATAEIRNFFETAVPTMGMDETYEECGVIHYNCEHIPSMAAHTSTQLLTGATFPFVQALAAGPDEALDNSAPLRRGTMCRAGWLTDELTASRKNLAFRPLEESLG